MEKIRQITDDISMPTGLCVKPEVNTIHNTFETSIEDKCVTEDFFNKVMKPLFFKNVLVNKLKTRKTRKIKKMDSKKNIKASTKRKSKK